MAWTIVDAPNDGHDDGPTTIFRVRTHNAVHSGDLVVFGLATTPPPSSYNVTDNTPGGSLAWVSAGSKQFASLSAEVIIRYAVASRTVNPLRIAVTPGLGESSAYLMVVAVYRHAGVPVADFGSDTAGTGSTPAAGLLTPSGVDELAVVFGFGKPTPVFLSADAPLNPSFISTTSTTFGGCLGDALSIGAPFTPTMHTTLSGPWGVVATLFTTLAPPHVGQPSSFLGSGIEPFPIRRKTERREDSPRQQRRRRLTFDLLK